MVKTPMYNAHVFLGPSLDLKTAGEILPNAHYHPPIQCGDIIRLLRLKPDLIVIIDGLYETTPAVWHKEILLAMEIGVEVWGAASMGALRAAELHHYGMHGFGEVFQDFMEGRLGDDDEVAVLHLSEEEQYSTINDAMVNIRATCHEAWKENALTLDKKNELIVYCKKQFYPYRSLNKAIKHLSQSDAGKYSIFSQWINLHGIIDVKRNDAITTLKHIHLRMPVLAKQSEQVNNPISMTCFLRELIISTNTTPFRHNAAWLPDIEKNIYALHQQSPFEYMLLAEVVSFVQKLIAFSSDEKKAIDNAALVKYIHSHQLYTPENDFIVYKDHSVLSEIYFLVCQSICMLHLTTHQLNENIPTLAHYYDLPADINSRSKKILRIIMVLIFSINQHMEDPDIHISKQCVLHHLKQIKNWRRYTQQQLKDWLAYPDGDRQFFHTLLNNYIVATSVHGLSAVKIEYYQWIYDVESMFN